MGWQLLATVALVCGCNNVFDLRATRLADAPPQPPPIDAPPAPVCPAVGTLPKFGDDLRQIDAKDCLGYVVGDNSVAMAQCNGMPARGPVDGVMQPVVVDPDPTAVPRMAPDGNTAIVSAYNTTSSKYEMRVYAWVDNGFAMMTSYVPPIDYQYGGEYFEFSTPSRGPNAHVVYSDYNYTSGITELVEIADAGNGTWTEAARYQLKNADTGDVMSVTEASLSPDGLRLVFMSYTSGFTGGGGVVTATPGTGASDVIGYGGGGYLCQYGTQVVMYADRASTSDPFNPARALDSVPDQLRYPYMTEDCGRIYFSALNRVYYFKQ